MAIKFEKIQAGMKLFQRSRGRMGNTTLTTIREHGVTILEVFPEKRCAKVSWNGNAPEIYRERDFANLYDWSMYDKSVAEIKRGVWDSVIKVTKKKASKSTGG